jgi:hypothetical protein
MRIGWNSAQPQILDRTADGEVVVALPIVANQLERAMQHIIEVATNRMTALSGAAFPVLCVKSSDRLSGLSSFYSELLQ